MLFVLNVFSNGQWVLTPGPENSSATSMVVSGNALIAGFSNNTGSHIYKSINSGDSWGFVQTLNVNGFPVTSMIGIDAVLLAAVLHQGIYRSLDGGATWNQLSARFFGYNGTSFINTESGIFASALGEGVFQSKDKGVSWVAVNNGITDKRILKLAKDDSCLYAAGYGGIFISRDRGNHWNSISTGLPNTQIDDIAVTDSIIYAVPSAFGVYRSTNKGTSWIADDSGLVKGKYYHGFGFYGGTIFLGGHHTGISVKRKNSSVWVTYGLNNSIVIDIVTASENVYALSQGYDIGIWRISLSEILRVDNKTTVRNPSALTLYQNYPNPFNPRTIITFRVAEFSPVVVLKVIDLVGRIVSFTRFEHMEAGDYQHIVDGTNLSSGAYFYQLSTPNMSKTKVMLLTK
jgi:hypothetical protein